MTILVLNGGSSSLKYALFDGETCALRRTVDDVSDHGAAVAEVLASIERPHAIGHRLVHGGPAHTQPALVDDALLATLARVVPFAPLHLPSELRMIGAARARFPNVPQVVCFDTGFHAAMPEVARRFPLPVRLVDAGLHRYGFHGLSYESIAAQVPGVRRAIFAHLGSGASMVAVRDGASIDTTMGFTPTGGLVMGTRSGDLDPGLLVYLLAHGYDGDTLRHLVDTEAGLLALSGGISDMRVLLASSDPRAAFAIDVFCYQARKWIGALAAALEGVEQLVFSGGIGEHAPEVRLRICRGLAHLGIELDDAKNQTGAAEIGRGTCSVRVVRTDEERAIAGHTRRLAG